MLRNKQANTNSEAWLQSPISPQRVSKSMARLGQICPKVDHGWTAASHEETVARDKPSPDGPAQLFQDLTTPTHRVRVYDDLLSPRRQPQTPEQLPESQHQSRLLGSYTAPVSRLRSSQILARTPATARRPRHSRVPSPVGMRTPGFEGLYGGHENEDDAALFEEASQAMEPESSTPSPRRAE